LLVPLALSAAIIGTNPESQPLTAARIATLPTAETMSHASSKSVPPVVM
jgi:hypothetical protein